MIHNSQVTVTSNCEIFNYAKNTQGDKIIGNSQNQNDFYNNSNNNYPNYAFQNENEFNTDNLFQFNNTNNFPCLSQKSQCSQFGIGNNNILNIPDFYHNNQGSDQDNYLREYVNSDNNYDYNKSIEINNNWGILNNDISDNNNQSINLISQKIYNFKSKNHSKKNDFATSINSYQNNLTSSKSSNKSNQNVYFVNNNKQKSPNHIIEALKIINETIENEIPDDNDILLKDNINKTREISNEKFNNFNDSSYNLKYSDKSVFLDVNKNSNNNQNIEDMNSQKKNYLENNINHKNDFTNCENMNINQKINDNPSSNKNISNLRNNKKFNYKEPENKENKINYINFFESQIKNREKSEFNNIQNKDENKKTTSSTKEDKIINKDLLNELRKNMENITDHDEKINLNIQKLTDNLETLENVFFSSFSFRNRNFFEFGKLQSEELKEKILVGDLDEITNILNIKEKELKINEGKDFNKIIEDDEKISKIKNNKVKNIDPIYDIKLKDNKEIDYKNEIKNKSKSKIYNINNNSTKEISNKDLKKANNLSSNFFIQSNTNISPPLLNKESYNINNIKYEKIDFFKSPTQKNENKEIVKTYNRVILTDNIEDKIFVKNEKKNSLTIKSSNTDQTKDIRNDLKILPNKVNPTNIVDQLPLNDIEQNIKEKETNIFPSNEVIRENKDKLQNKDILQGGNHLNYDKIIKNLGNSNKKNDKQNKHFSIQAEYRNLNLDQLIDQIKIPNLQDLNNLKIKVNLIDFSKIFVPWSEDQVNTIADKENIITLNKAFEDKKNLVKYSNYIMNILNKLFWSFENFRVNFKKYWEVYLMNYIMEIEYYNFICENFQENTKFDFDKLEKNINIISEKYYIEN